MISKHTIQNEILNYKKEIIHLGVKKLGLFGSVVRGESTGSSDIDILVEFEKDKKNFDNFMNLSFLLEEILDNKVDLVTKESLSENLKSYILPEVEYIEVE